MGVTISLVLVGASLEVRLGVMGIGGGVLMVLALVRKVEMVLGAVW